MHTKVDNLFLNIHKKLENLGKTEKKFFLLIYNILYFFLNVFIAIINNNSEIAKSRSTSIAFFLIIWGLFFCYDTDELKNSTLIDKINFGWIILTKIGAPVLIYFLLKQETLKEELITNAFYLSIVALNIVIIFIVSFRKERFFQKTYLLFPIISLIVFILILSTFIYINTWGFILIILLIGLINYYGIKYIDKIDKMYLDQKRASIPKIKSADVVFKNSNNGWTISATVDSSSLKSATFNLGRDSFDKAYKEAFTWIQANK